MDNPAPVDHPVHDLVRARWSPRAFAAAAPEDAVLLRCLEAARWAASCFNDQPWSFVGGVKGRGEGWQKVHDTLVEANQTWAQHAPVLLISVARADFARNGKPNRHAWHDVGQAAAQLSLQAVAEGLVVHQMAGFSADAAREAFAIPEGHDPVAAIAIGLPGDADTLPDALRERERAPRERRPLRDVLHGATWGEPPAYLPPDA